MLSDENVKEAHFSIPSQPNVTLNYGSHGATGLKVWFYTNAWNIPKDYALGTTTVAVSYTLFDGRTATTQYEINIVP